MRRARPRVPSGVGSQVFIIHGHDVENVRRLQGLLDQMGLDCVILAEMPGRGRVMIEKFEQEAQRAAFAFALMTRDDEVVLEDDRLRQARPNVLIEVGWFLARGRERVCLLAQAGTYIPSDIEGIHRIEFDTYIDEKTPEIERELKGADLLAG